MATSPVTAADIARASSAAAKLSDTDLVGQVLVPYMFGEDANDVTTAAASANRHISGVSTPAEMIAKYRLGGFILTKRDANDPTGGTNKTTNLTTPAQIRKLTAGLQAAGSKLAAASALPGSAPLLIGTDQEYGVVNRIRSGVVQLPAAMAFGAAGQPGLTRAAWAAAGGDLVSVGLNTDFAPDADVIAHAGNTVIGSRSFGGTPAAVSAQVAAAVAGLQSNRLAATLKHFPGHGDTTTNSHYAMPVLKQPLAQLTSNDLAPFRAGIAAGTEMIMSGHLDVVSIDPGVPASFSSKVLTDLLRGQMGFTGVVITDSLGMEPARKWPVGEAAVRAFLAGNDMLLMPPNVASAQKGLLAALASGRIPRQRMLDSVTRILALKLTVAAGPSGKPTDTSAGRSAAMKVAAAAVTQFTGSCGGILIHGPITLSSTPAYAAVRDHLADALQADGATVVRSGGTVVRLVGYEPSLSQVKARTEMTVAVDTPYVLAHANSPLLLATFSSAHVSMVALADVITGKARAAGKSPVPVTGLPRTACEPPSP